MAKSLRSKWKRKMRAAKRERYGQKELKKLTEMLIKAGEYPLDGIKQEDVTLEDAATANANDSVVEVQENETAPLSSEIEPMEVETRGRRRHRADRQISQSAEPAPVPAESATDVDMKVERVYNKKTMRDQFGNYPPWMNSRKIVAQKKKITGIKKKRAKSIGNRRRR